MSKSLSQFSVMIVDDNRHMRALVFSILRAFGIQRIKEMADGESALREVEAIEPDLVITDWNMEPMDGLSLVKSVRSASSDAVRYVPILMLTGHAETEKVKAARDSGVHEFMVKPVAAKDLYTRMLMIAENPRPFIKTEEYFGPDRRRRDMGPPADIDERRKDVTEADALSPEEALAS